MFQQWSCIDDIQMPIFWDKHFENLPIKMFEDLLHQKQGTVAYSQKLSKKSWEILVTLTFTWIFCKATL